ncbi:hypothetical protein MHTCC0001_36690 [Flavobacteriaceae bacterium MHTCC 0001]
MYHHEQIKKDMMLGFFYLDGGEGQNDRYPKQDQDFISKKTRNPPGLEVEELHLVHGGGGAPVGAAHVVGPDLQLGDGVIRGGSWA